MTSNPTFLFYKWTIGFPDKEKRFPSPASPRPSLSLQQPKWAPGLLMADEMMFYNYDPVILPHRSSPTPLPLRWRPLLWYCKEGPS